jgi:tetratricopeptide (TPR) repeat protein
MFTLPFTFGNSGVQDAEKVAFLEKIADDPKMNGTLKAMIYSTLGTHYESCNNFKKSAELFSKMGVISHWQLLGSFDNTSGSGYSKDWGALDKSSANDVFKNKVDADIKWFTQSYNRNDNWTDFGYFCAVDNVIAYAQSFVNSPAAQEVFFRIGVSGSLKVWVNDQLVIAVPEERNTDLDVYSAKVKLNQGINRILVQIGQSDIDAANFMVRLTDADANPVAGLTGAAVYGNYTKTQGEETTTPLPFFPEQFLESQTNQEPDNLLVQIALAETYLHNDKAYEATKILKKMEDTYPRSTFLKSLLIDAYARAKNRTDYDKEIESIKQNDPESFTALQAKYDDAMDAEKYDDAEDIYTKAVTLYGSNETTDRWSLAIASKQKRDEDVIRIGKELYAKYPDDESYMELSYAIENNVSQNSKSALAIVEKYCKNYFDGDALKFLADIFFEQGNNEKGLSILRQRIDAMPYAVGYLSDMANTLYNMQDYKGALAVTDEMLALTPYVADFYNMRGYIYRDMKDTGNAKESFQQSIYYGPTSYDSRSQLRLLENKKELFELFPKNDLDVAIAKDSSSKDTSKDNAIILFNDNQLVVYPEAAKEYHFDFAVKILNQTGIDNWKEHAIDYNSNTQKLIIDKAEVVKANGNKIKAETDDNDIVFTNLEVGDVCHLEYRVQDYSTGQLAKHFFDQFPFQYNIPSKENNYSILLPADKTFNYVVSKEDVKPDISNVEDMKLYQWKSENQPAVKQEPYMTQLVDDVPVLSFSSIPNWRYVSDWYKDLTTSKFNSDYVLKETLADLLKGHENASPLEKAKIFYDYILENITYSDVSFMHSNFVPQKASRTITTRLGDCKDMATLFVALCRESGIDANLVLIATRDNGRNQLPLPSVGFNHCIAQLNIDNKIYYLELTNKQLPFGAALPVDLASDILPIPFGDDTTVGDKLLTMEMPFRKANSITRFSTVTFNGNDMTLSTQSIRSEANAAYYRDAYRDLGDDDRLKQFNQSMASGFSTPIKVTDLKFENLDNLVDSVVTQSTLEVDNAMQDVAGMKIIKLPWTDGINSLEEVTAETRNFSFELWQYTPEDITTEQITITLPQGKQFVEAPKDVRFECPNAVYTITVTAKSPDVFVIQRTLQRKSEQVSAEQYEAFRNFINQVSQTDNKQFAIK